MASVVQRSIRVLAPAVMAVLVSLPITASAAATTPLRVGWWWRAQSSPTVTVPAPPQVPEGGLYVEGAPDGPNAVAALRVTVPWERVGVAIVLDVADERGGDSAIMLLCPTTSTWQESYAGQWSERPEAECEGQAVEGVRADDGSKWTFNVEPFTFMPTRHFVVLPGSDPTRPSGLQGSVFSVAFKAPNDDVFITQAAPTQRNTPPMPPPTPERVPIDPYFDGVQFTPPTDVDGDPEPQPDVAPDPSVIPPSVTPASPPTVPINDPIGSGRDARALATLVALLSVGVAGVLSRDHGLALPSYLRPGSQKADDPAPVDERMGGVGRFRRPRSSAPPPL